MAENYLLGGAVVALGGVSIIFFTSTAIKSEACSRANFNRATSSSAFVAVALPA
jgi:hypothetical protein